MNFPTSCLPHSYFTSWFFVIIGSHWESVIIVFSVGILLPAPLPPPTLFLLCLLYSLLFLFKQLMIYLVSGPCIIVTVDFYGHQYYSPFIWFTQEQEKKERWKNTVPESYVHSSVCCDVGDRSSSHFHLQTYFLLNLQAYKQYSYGLKLIENCSFSW